MLTYQCVTVLSLGPSLPGCAMADGWTPTTFPTATENKGRDTVKDGLHVSGDVIGFAFSKMTPAHGHGRWRIIRRLESEGPVWRLRAWGRSERMVISAKTRTRRRQICERVV